MARHRSPQGRRAHLGPPLPAVMAAAGVGGGAHRSISLPQLTPSLPVRFVATVVAGGAVAAAGQHALAEALPAAADGANVLRIGVNELLSSTPDVQAAALSAPLVADPPAVAAVAAAVGPVTPEPVVADAASLVKAADLQQAAADAAARAAEQAKVAEAARVAEAAKKAAASTVEMIIGRVTSGFGARWGSSHQGLDIAAPIGTPIRVPLAGTVIDSGPASGFGLWVRVRHADGTITVYGHINRSLVRVGQKVTAGQEIAEVGNRGQSTGPHLHIEVITPGGTKINPRPWLDQHGIRY
ncbi:M23 family metallopeptidase [Pseudonocardia xinjiangensis]|uniref:M23 family metallopeptidase n=1 Tax=Pseudonocardia xinjiangensis TaxID=75289 RepID=UPI003D94DBEB